MGLLQLRRRGWLGLLQLRRWGLLKPLQSRFSVDSHTMWTESSLRGSGWLGLVQSRVSIGSHTGSSKGNLSGWSLKKKAGSRITSPVQQNMQRSRLTTNGVTLGETFTFFSEVVVDVTLLSRRGGRGATDGLLAGNPGLLASRFSALGPPLLGSAGKDWVVSVVTEVTYFG